MNIYANDDDYELQSQFCACKKVNKRIGKSCRELIVHSDLNKMRIEK